MQWAWQRWRGLHFWYWMAIWLPSCPGFFHNWFLSLKFNELNLENKVDSGKFNLSTFPTFISLFQWLCWDLMQAHSMQVLRPGRWSSANIRHMLCIKLRIGCPNLEHLASTNILSSRATSRDRAGHQASSTCWGGMSRAWLVHTSAQDNDQIYQNTTLAACMWIFSKPMSPASGECPFECPACQIMNKQLI